MNKELTELDKTEELKKLIWDCLEEIQFSARNAVYDTDDRYENMVTKIDEIKREVLKDLDTYQCVEYPEPKTLEKLDKQQVYIAGQVAVCMWIKTKVDQYLNQQKEKE